MLPGGNPSSWEELAVDDGNIGKSWFYSLPQQKNKKVTQMNCRQATQQSTYSEQLAPPTVSGRGVDQLPVVSWSALDSFLSKRHRCGKLCSKDGSVTTLQPVLCRRVLCAQ